MLRPASWTSADDSSEASKRSKITMYNSLWQPPTFPKLTLLMTLALLNSVGQLPDLGGAVRESDTAKGLIQQAPVRLSDATDEKVPARESCKDSRIPLGAPFGT